MAKTNTNQSNIPRPLNCFLMYRLEKQKEIVAKCVGANHRDISKIIAKWWQEASEEEKKPFRERARIAKQEHRKLYPDYKYTPKKKVTPKRVYIRRNKKDQFTSRAQENNKLMEMIYGNPTALKTIAKDDKSTPATVSDKVMARKDVSGAIKNSVSLSNVKVEDHKHDQLLRQYEVISQMSSEIKMEDYYCRPSCQYQAPSKMSPTSTFSETPQVSPYTDCYSEYDMASPGLETTPFEAGYFQLAQSRAVSPFSVLDTPYINDFNAYGCQEAGLVDNFYLLNSISNHNYINSTQELGWDSSTGDVSFLFDKQQLPQQQVQCTNDDFMMMQFNQSIQYINPVLLHM